MLTTEPIHVAKPSLDRRPAMSDPQHLCITARGVNLWYAKFQALINVTVDIQHEIGRASCRERVYGLV